MKTENERRQAIEAELSALQRDGVHLLVWCDSVKVHRSMFPSRPECEAYAAIHGGIIVHLWPAQRSAFAPAFRWGTRSAA